MQTKLAYREESSKQIESQSESDGQSKREKERDRECTHKHPDTYHLLSALFVHVIDL